MRIIRSDGRLHDLRLVEGPLTAVVRLDTVDAGRETDAKALLSQLLNQ